VQTISTTEQAISADKKAVSASKQENNFSASDPGDPGGQTAAVGIIAAKGFRVFFKYFEQTGLVVYV
jgi:hypothetical protein